MSCLGWSDLELTRNGQVKAIGAHYEDRTLHRGELRTSADRDAAMAELEKFLAPATYVAGHNLLAFDAPHIQAFRPNSSLLRKPVIDTLVLSALAFPKKPYHKLIKDYKLIKDAISDPVRDCKLAQDVLHDAIGALTALPAEVRSVLAALLQLRIPPNQHTLHPQVRGGLCGSAFGPA